MSGGWRDLIKNDPLPWLLEPDLENPAVRYLALRDLESLPQDSTELIQAKARTFSGGTIANILAKQRPDGYWVKPGGGYGPKFTGSVWSLTTLAQAGADRTEPKVLRAAEYILEHTLSAVGWFSYNGSDHGFLHCHSGYLGATMLDLGFGDDPRVMTAIDWHSRIITGEGIAGIDSEDAARYYHYAPGPDFICSSNAKKPCAWGAVKALGALGRVPAIRRTPTMQTAIDRVRQFFFNTDLTVCDFPTRDKTNNSNSWFKFGFPLLYASDMLEVLEAMTRLGDGQDPRLEAAWQLVIGKQNAQGRWSMEYSYNDRMWSDIEQVGKPSKWVTLRALRAVKEAFPD